MLLISVTCDIGQLLSADRHGDSIIKAAKGLLYDEQSPKRRKILADLLLNLEDRSELESRDEDEGWFQGRSGKRGLELIEKWKEESTRAVENMVSFQVSMLGSRLNLPT